MFVATQESALPSQVVCLTRYRAVNVGTEANPRNQPLVSYVNASNNEVVDR